MADKEAYGVYKLNNKLLLKALVFVLVLVIGMIGTFSAYAMNLDYLEPSKWDNAGNITSVNIKKTSTDRELNGVMKYCTDEKEGCLYTAFFIEEPSLEVSRDDVRIKYEISGDHSSAFAVCKDGIVDCEKEPDFSVYANFSVYEDYSNAGCFIAALDFEKVKYDTAVRISLYVNGRFYNGIKTIIVPPTKITADKPAKQTTSRKSSKDKTVSFGEKTSKAAGTQRSTKFSAQAAPTAKSGQGKNSVKSFSYSKSSAAENGVQKEDVTTAPNREEQLANEQSEGYSVRGRLSQHSKNILLAALIVAGIGLCFLIASAFTSSDKKADDKDADADTDKNETETDKE